MRCIYKHNPHICGDGFSELKATCFFLMTTLPLHTLARYLRELFIITREARVILSLQSIQFEFTTYISLLYLCFLRNTTQLTSFIQIPPKSEIWYHKTSDYLVSVSVSDPRSGFSFTPLVAVSVPDISFPFPCLMKNHQRNHRFNLGDEPLTDESAVIRVC